MGGYAVVTKLRDFKLCAFWLPSAGHVANAYSVCQVTFTLSFWKMKCQHCKETVHFHTHAHTHAFFKFCFMRRWVYSYICLLSSLSATIPSLSNAVALIVDSMLFYAFISNIAIHTESDYSLSIICAFHEAIWRSECIAVCHGPPTFVWHGAVHVIVGSFAGRM